MKFCDVIGGVWLKVDALTFLCLAHRNDITTCCPRLHRMLRLFDDRHSIVVKTSSVHPAVVRGMNPTRACVTRYLRWELRRLLMVYWERLNETSIAAFRSHRSFKMMKLKPLIFNFRFINNDERNSISNGAFLVFVVHLCLLI